MSTSFATYTPRAPSSTPLDAFFKIYEPDFEYNPAASATDEFKRLCEVKRWNGEGDRAYAHRNAYNLFKDALVQQFNVTYGTDVNSLTSWQALVSAVGIEPIPNSVKKCKTIILRLHINLVDLVDARKDGPNRKVKLFGSLRDLRDYTIEEDKIFPKKTAYTSGLLRFLLREIMNEYKGHRGARGSPKSYVRPVFGTHRQSAQQMPSSSSHASSSEPAVPTPLHPSQPSTTASLPLPSNIPPETNIELVPAKGKTSRELKSQTPRIQWLVNASYVVIEGNIILKDAFPKDETAFVHQAMMDTVQVNLPIYDEVHARMKSDDKYKARLASLGVHRISTFHELVKASAEGVVKARPDLYPLSKLKPYISLNGFIFPVSSGGVSDFTKPFEADSGVVVIRDLMKNKKDLFDKVVPSFPFKIDPETRTREYELPHALVALVYTAIHRVLEVKLAGKKACGSFSAARYASTYSAFVGDMDKMAETDENAHHALFHGLYNRVMLDAA